MKDWQSHYFAIQARICALWEPLRSGAEAQQHGDKAERNRRYAEAAQLCESLDCELAALRSALQTDAEVWAEAVAEFDARMATRTKEAARG